MKAKKPWTKPESGSRTNGPRWPGNHQWFECTYSHERLFLFDANNWLKQAEIAAAMSLEALKANMKPYTKIHEVRGFTGAVRSADAIRKMVAGGDLEAG